MMSYLLKCCNLHRGILLVDVSVGLQDSDKMLIELLTEMNQIYILVMTKADKVKQLVDLETKTVQVIDFIRSAGSLCVPVVHCVSAEGNNYGIFELKSNLIFHNS